MSPDSPWSCVSCYSYWDRSKQICLRVTKFSRHSLNFLKPSLVSGLSNVSVRFIKLGMLIKFLNTLITLFSLIFGGLMLRAKLQQQLDFNVYAFLIWLVPTAPQ